MMNKVMIFLTIFGFVFLIHTSVLRAEEKWPGVDRAVVEKFAKEHGREAKASLINTDQGDLLLFLFLIAGAVGGFAAGYYWRLLIERKPKSRE
jgi:cobalt/nickel transport protein